MTVKKAAKKVVKVKAHDEAEQPEPLTTEDKLDGLIAWMKDHGLHYDGSRAPEEADEPEPQDAE